MPSQNTESNVLTQNTESNALTTSTPGQDPIPEMKMGYSEEVERPIEGNNQKDDKAPNKSLRE